MQEKFDLNNPVFDDLQSDDNMPSDAAEGPLNAPDALGREMSAGGNIIDSRPISGDQGGISEGMAISPMTLDDLFTADGEIDLSADTAAGGPGPGPFSLVESLSEGPEPLALTQKEWEELRPERLRITYITEQGKKVHEVATYPDYIKVWESFQGTGQRITEERVLLPEVPPITKADWAAHSYVRAILTVGTGYRPAPSMVVYDDQPKLEERERQITVFSFQQYVRALDFVHAQGLRITEADFVPSAITPTTAAEMLDDLDDDILYIDGFPKLSNLLRLKRHDSMLLAGPPGSGKTAIALNMLYGLHKKYPVIYFDLENGPGELLKRLISRHSGILQRRLDDYRRDPQTRAAVDRALSTMLSDSAGIQIITDTYDISQIENIIARATKDREEKTIIFIDHGQLITDDEFKGSGDTEKFTRISRHLRRIARAYNVITIVLLQMNREGIKAQTGESGTQQRPTLSALKNASAWGEDATKVCFPWYIQTDNEYKITTVKNRSGAGVGEFFDILLDPPSWGTQRFIEAAGGAEADQAEADQEELNSARENPREKRKRIFSEAFWLFQQEKGGRPTCRDMADYLAEVTKKDWKWKQARNEAGDVGGYNVILVGKNQSADDLIEECLETIHPKEEKALKEAQEEYEDF